MVGQYLRLETSSAMYLVLISIQESLWHTRVEKLLRKSYAPAHLLISDHLGHAVLCDSQGIECCIAAKRTPMQRKRVYSKWVYEGCIVCAVAVVNPSRGIGFATSIRVDASPLPSRVPCPLPILFQPDSNHSLPTTTLKCASSVRLSAMTMSVDVTPR
jgi:hypothetical protein